MGYYCQHQKSSKFCIKCITYLESSLKFPIHISSMAFLVQTAFYVAVCVTTDDAVAVFLSTAISTYACA